MAQYDRLRAQRAPVRPLGARFAGLVAPSPDKEVGPGHFHPSGVPLRGIHAALKIAHHRLVACRGVLPRSLRSLSPLRVDSSRA